MLRRIKNVSISSGKYVTIDENQLIDFSSNNYLGLRDNINVKKAACDAIMKYGAGSGASRIITGNAEIYMELEEELADFKGKERCILFNSGYDANVGVISAIMDKKDVVFSDRLNHASIIDGIQLSGAKLIRYKHNDVLDLEKKLKENRKNYKKALVITDSVFSMDGDKADLRQIADLKSKFEFIFMVDEAHGSGVFGKNGAGVAEEQDVLKEIDISMGTLGKAFGGQGAFICTSGIITDFIINRARSLIFSTALNPAAVGSAIEALRIIKDEPFRRKKLLENSEFLREMLVESGYDILNSSTQIVPLIFRDNATTLKAAEHLTKNGILAAAIRPPAVPEHTARIRLAVTYNHEKSDLIYLIEKLKEVKKWI